MDLSNYRAGMRDFVDQIKVSARDCVECSSVLDGFTDGFSDAASVYDDLEKQVGKYGDDFLIESLIEVLENDYGYSDEE